MKLAAPTAPWKVCDCLFALNCLPSTTVRPQLFALNYCLPSTTVCPQLTSSSAEGLLESGGALECMSQLAHGILGFPVKVRSTTTVSSMPAAQAGDEAAWPWWWPPWRGVSSTRLQPPYRRIHRF